jgi:hypothetical protein
MKPYRLPRCRVLAVACVLVIAGLSQAAAQFPPVPGQAASSGQQSVAFPPPPAQQDSVFPPPPGQGQASAPTGASAPDGASAPGGFPPPGAGFAVPSGSGFSGGGGPGPPDAQRVCLNFPTIREDVEKSAALIKTASERKATREEVCPLFKTFAAKEGKMIAFLETNQKLCGVPPKIIVQVKTNHASTVRIRNAVCSTGPMPGAARGPTLSDALGGPIIADDTSAKLPGRGTFDTLTGNALQK